VKTKHRIRKLLFNLLFDPTESNARIDMMCREYVHIGKNLIAAPGSMITAHDASLNNKTGEHRVEDVWIGDNVYIGANAVILPGAKIGNNAIIGAGSVVNGRVPDNMVVSGNPARVLYAVDHYRQFCQLRKSLKILHL
jgi:acetyltransferase-like isoleucine patch superfamily enzyme